MTPSEIALVRASFAAVVPLKTAAAAMFYERLFAIDPSTRPLFRGDPAIQGAKLMAALAHVVRALDRPATVAADLQALARRHAGYGVIPAHYDSVGAALLWTLERGLGAAFTPEVRDAWAAAYQMLSDVMLAAATAPSSDAA
jgi:nitric oxide dioxygenase